MNLHLPNPPSPNAIWRAVKGRVIKSAEYRAWIDHAGLIINSKKPKPIPGPVFIQITAQENRRRDLDGFIKAPLDLLVTHKLIDGDNGTTVRGIAMDWSDDIEGIQVRVTSMRVMGDGDAGCLSAGNGE